MTDSEKPTATTWLPCNHCKQRTKHDLSVTHDNDYSEWDICGDDEFPIYTMNLQWTLWICRGCETPVLQKRTNYDGHTDSQDRPIYSYEHFPVRTEFSYDQRHFSKLPDQIKIIYKEACAAYNAELPLLGAGGLRALTEAICRDKGASGGNLEKRIDALKAFLPENLVRNLHSLRYLGNEALHELRPPEMGDLRLGLDILGDLMNYLYDLDYKANLLARRHESNNKG